MHGFGNTFGGFPGTDDRFVLLHTELKEFVVIDLGCYPGGIYDIHCYRAAVSARNDDIFFLPGPAGFVGDLAYRADCIAGPVPGNTVCQRGLSRIGRTVYTDPGPLLLEK